MFYHDAMVKIGLLFSLRVVVYPIPKAGASME